MDDTQQESPEIAQETPREDVFVAPSIHKREILSGSSYSHYSPIPEAISGDLPSTECVLGVDEAGRGPVLGGMVYALLYLPLSLHRSLLAETYHFDDSKVLTPTVRSNLMRLLCTPNHPLHKSCGWATKTLSARDISAGMLKPAGVYNLNAQAMDATIELIKGIVAMGVNVKEIYIDTIGAPPTYQKKLERIFPTISITVAKKADSLYPCVSAASVCAKVTRDAALQVCYEARKTLESGVDAEGWGSGYPSDGRCVRWLKREMDPVFGWGNECRFSWGTAKDMLEAKGSGGAKVDWPIDEDEDTMRVTDFFSGSVAGRCGGEGDQLRNWYGTAVGEEAF